MTREEAIAAMEALQKLSCGYLPGGACDCKYGLKPEILKCENYGRSVSRPMDERTGCPELRDMKALLEAMSDEDFERFLGMSNGMIFAEKEVDDPKSDGLTDLDYDSKFGGTMKFEVGKYYVHTGSKSYLAILGVLDTTLYGRAMIAEQAGRHGHSFIPVGGDEDSTVGYVECSKEEWMTNFS